jgi:transcriptional antiterminator RfaH
LAPLFPCYCFVAVENGWWDARWCVGVVGLIMNGTRPAVVADGIINAIREREIRGAVELPVRPMRRGDRVRILAGPFRDQLALYAGMKSRERVEILLALLGGQARVTLSKSDIEAV